MKRIFNWLSSQANNAVPHGLFTLVSAVLAVLGAVAAIAVSATDPLASSSAGGQSGQHDPEATKITVAAAEGSINPKHCVIAEGLPTELVHRFNTAGEYYVTLQPGQYTITVVCDTPGLTQGSSAAPAHAIGKATFEVTQTGGATVEVAVR